MKYLAIMLILILMLSIHLLTHHFAYKVGFDEGIVERDKVFKAWEEDKKVIFKAWKDSL